MENVRRHRTRIRFAQLTGADHPTDHDGLRAGSRQFIPGMLFTHTFLIFS